MNIHEKLLQYLKKYNLGSDIKLKNEEDNPDPKPKERIYSGKDLWKE